MGCAGCDLCELRLSTGVVSTRLCFGPPQERQQVSSCATKPCCEFVRWSYQCVNFAQTSWCFRRFSLFFSQDLCFRPVHFSEHDWQFCYHCEIIVPRDEATPISYSKEEVIVTYCYRQ